MSQKMQRWTRFEIKILSLKELRGKLGCVNTDEVLIGEFSEDTAQNHYSGQVSGESVRNCQEITDIGVSVTSSVRIIWLVRDFSHELFTTGWCLFVRHMCCIMSGRWWIWIIAAACNNIGKGKTLPSSVAGSHPWVGGGGDQIYPGLRVCRDPWKWLCHNLGASDTKLPGVVIMAALILS